MSNIDPTHVAFRIDFQNDIPEIDHDSFHKYISNKQSPMYLWQKEYYPDGNHKSVYEDRTIDEVMRSDDIKHLYYMNVVFGFRSSQMPFRAWYNRTRNILITAQTKAGSRSINALLHHEHRASPVGGWENITHYCDLMKAQANNPEIHSCLRDPMVRLSSYLRMAGKDIALTQGFIMSNPALATHLGSLDNHGYPQHLQCLYRVDAELADSIPLHWKSIAQRMLDPSDPEGIHHLFEIADFNWLLDLSFNSWRYKAEIFDPERIVANPNQKFYWVWDTDHDEKQYGMMQSLNRAVGLWTQHDMDNIPEVKSVVSHGRGTNSRIHPFTGKECNSKQFISDNLQFFERMKKDHHPDYAWMDTLHFENTPDNKPQYVL